MPSFLSFAQLLLPFREPRAPIPPEPGRARLHGQVPPPAAQPLSGLAATLSRKLGKTTVIEVHDNRSTMISYRRRADQLTVRLHHMFLTSDGARADLPLILADFISGRGRRRAEASRWLDTFIRSHQHTIRPPKPPRPAPSQGSAYDLRRIFDALNQRFFDGAIAAHIGWGRPPGKRRRRSIKMGVYLHEHRQIRIHPALDRPEVPPYFVEFVVYHEMCHQSCPPEPGPGGRTRIHHRAFRARERLHPDRDRALAWEKQHLRSLLRSPP